MIIIGVLYAIVGWGVGVAINYLANQLPNEETLRQKYSCPGYWNRRDATVPSGLFALLNGTSICPSCGQRHATTIRAVAVELVTPLFFVFLLIHFGLSLYLLLASLYTAFLILITVTDLEHRLIFNVVILPAILLGLGGAFFTPDLTWKAAIFGGGVAFILSYITVMLGRGRLGVGDITLSTFLGLILGFPHIILSLLFGVFLGGAVAALLLITRQVSMKTYIPYGPFLTTTGWIMLIWGSEIWQYYF